MLTSPVPSGRFNPTTPEIETYAYRNGPSDSCNCRGLGRDRMMSPIPLGTNEALGTAGHGGGFLGISNNIDFFTQSGWTAIVLSNYTVMGFEACAPIVVKMRELAKASAPAGGTSR